MENRSMPPISLPQTDMLLDVLLYAVLPSLLASVAVMALVERFGGAKQAPAGAAFGFTTGAVLGLWLRNASFNGWPMAPDQSLASALATWLGMALTPMSVDSAWNRLPWAALGILCVGRVARLPGLPTIDGWLLRAAASVTAAWLVVPAMAQEEFAWLMPAFGLVICAEWMVLDALAANPPGGTVIFIIALTFFVASMVLIQIGWATKADAAIVFSSALTGIAIVAAWRNVDGGGAVPIAALLLPSLMLMGQQGTESEVPWDAFALTAGAPLMLALTLPLRKWQSVWLRVLQVALVLLPLGAAAYLTGPIEFPQ
jgi:hypothetical protein